MPISNKQLHANRANAKKSTGPNSPDGKQASSKNSTTHGLHSRRFIVEPATSSQTSTPSRPPSALKSFPSAPSKSTPSSSSSTPPGSSAAPTLLEAKLHNPDSDPEDQLSRLERLSRLRGALERSYQRAYRRLRELQSSRAAELHPLQPHRPRPRRPHSRRPAPQARQTLRNRHDETKPFRPVYPPLSMD